MMSCQNNPTPTLNFEKKNMMTAEKDENDDEEEEVDADEEEEEEEEAEECCSSQGEEDEGEEEENNIDVGQSRGSRRRSHHYYHRNPTAESSISQFSHENLVVGESYGKQEPSPILIISAVQIPSFYNGFFFLVSVHSLN